MRFANGFPVRCTSACTNTQKMDALLPDKPASPHEFQTKKNGRGDSISASAVRRSAGNRANSPKRNARLPR